MSDEPASVIFLTCSQSYNGRLSDADTLQTPRTRFATTKEAA